MPKVNAWSTARGARKAALIVAAAALIIRLGFLWGRGVPEPLLGDALQYHSYGANLLSEGIFTGIDGLRASRMPGYPLFVAVAFAVAGPSTAAVLVLQCVAGALTCLFIFLIAESLLEPPWPLLCCAAAALYYDLIAAAVSPLAECLYAALIAAAFAALYHKNWPPEKRALGAGAVFGLAYLVRPEIVAYAGLLLCGLPWLLKTFKPKHALLGLAAMSVAVAIWTGRNLALLHHVVPASTMGEQVLYLGLRHPAEDLGMRQDRRFTAPAELGELERGRAYREAYNELRGSLTAGQILKAYAFNAVTVYYPFLPQYDVTYAALIPLWSIGFLAALKLKQWWPLAFLTPAVTVVYMFFGGPASRYRYGFAPLLLLLAALGAKTLAEKIRPQRFKWGLALWGGLNAAIWLWAPQFRQAALAVRDALWH